MKKIDFYKIRPSQRADIFNEASTQLGVTPFAVEKDWWVSRTIETIFQMEVAEHLVFKGGTSLSKAWKIINRFSEDIDLAIDREFFHKPLKTWSRGERTKLRRHAGKYFTEVFFVQLQESLIGRGYNDLQFRIIESSERDKDPRVLEIYYPNIIAQQNDYILPRVQVEVSCRALREPYTMKTFGSMVDETFVGADFADPLFTVPTVDAQRTFLEKLFLLQEEFQRPAAKMRVDRLSRHLYDLFHLSKSGVAEGAINDKHLYEGIVLHRHLFSRLSGVNYNLHNPGQINPVPPERVIKHWESDYAKMRADMIFDDPAPTFDELIANLQSIRSELQKTGWAFELVF